MERKNIVFLSSSYVNLAHLFADKYKEYDIFLIADRKFPHEEMEMDNYYTYSFGNEKQFEKNKVKYFDSLAVYVEQFEPDFIITNNYTKLLPKSFIEFVKFRNKKTKIINLHHADLRKGNEFKGLNADIKEFLKTEEITTTLHLIEDEKMDEGKILDYTYPTTLKELKTKTLIHKKEDIINLRLRNVILSYHERTKVLKHLYNVLKKNGN